MSVASNTRQSGGTENVKLDLPASLVVVLVALPLCMGIAIASGAPPAKGLLTGIVGGIVVGAVAGSPLQVSGPAAGLAVIVFGVVHQSYVDHTCLELLVNWVWRNDGTGVPSTVPWDALHSRHPARGVMVATAF